VRWLCLPGGAVSAVSHHQPGYWEYYSDASQCQGCELRPKCTKSASHTKVVVRHVWEEAKERVDANRLTERGKRLYARRKETVERSFADAKEVARPPLCALPGIGEGARAVPAGGDRAEHEEDRASAGAVYTPVIRPQGANRCHGKPLFNFKCKYRRIYTPSRPLAKRFLEKQNPAKNGGVCRRSEAAKAAYSLFPLQW